MEAGGAGDEQAGGFVAADISADILLWVFMVWVPMMWVLHTAGDAGTNDAAVDGAGAAGAAGAA